MTREKEIKELTRNLHSQFEKTIGFGDVVRLSIQWADEHPKNPWRDAKKDPPENDSTVLVILEGGYWTRGCYRGKFWYAQRPQRNYYTRTGDANYWMRIPELPKGGEL